MKKITFLSFCLVFFSTISSIFGQGNFPENDPCNSPCLPKSGIISGKNPLADFFSPNMNLPCGVNTSEDNPTWFKFAPNSSSMTFSFTTTNCNLKDSLGNSSGIQLSVFEGEECGGISNIGCLNCVASGTFTVSTVPNQIYYLQIDGCAENVCDFIVTYDGSKLANLTSNTPKPTISTPQSCNGETTCYHFDMGNGLAIRNITITPSTAGTIIENATDGRGNICVTWEKSGSAKICGNLKQTICPQGNSIQQVCYDVVVNNVMDTSNLVEPPLWEQRGVASIAADKFVFDPSRKNAFYGLYGGKAFFTKDNGATFNFVKSNFYMYDIHPTVDSNIIYASPEYKSVDGGKNWSGTVAAPGSLSSSSSGSLINPYKPNNIISFSRDNNGTYTYYLSKDKGDTWVKLNIPNLSGYYLTVAYSKDKYFFFNYAADVLVSTSDFVNYTTTFLSNFSDINSYSITSSVTPTGGIRFYAKASYNRILTLNTEQTNAWVFASKFPNVNLGLQTAAFANSNDVYATFQDSLNSSRTYYYKSSDMAKTWKSILTISSNNSNTTTGWVGAGGSKPQTNDYSKISIHPFFSNKIVLSHYNDSGNDCYFSNDSGANLEQIYVNKADENKVNTPTVIGKEYGNNGISTGNYYNLSFLDKDRLFSTQWQTTNDGKSWKLQSGLNLNTNYSKVVKHPTKNTLFISNTQKGQLLYSLDDGNSWKIMSAFPFVVTSINMSATNPNTMYVSGEKQIWKTQNLESLDKATWQLYYTAPTSPNGKIAELTVLKDSTLLIALTNFTLVGGYSAESKEYYVKEANTTPARLIDFALFSKVIIDPTDVSENTFYGVESYDAINYQFPIVASKDRGKTWKAISGGDPLRPTSLALNPLNPIQLFASSGSGIWVSDNINDACVRWKKLKNYDLIRVSDLKFNPYEKDELWAVTTYHGVQKAKVPNKLLLANTSVSNKIDCKNKTAQLKVSPFSQTQPNSPLTYNWSGPNNLTSSLQQVTVFPTVTSKYFVTVTNAAGQKAVDSVTVFVDKTPPNVTLVTTPANATVCGGKIVVIEAQTTSLGYVWSNGATNQKVIEANITGKYFVTVTGANGCTNSASVDITAFAPLQKATQVFFIIPASKTLKVNLLAVVQSVNPSVKSITPAFVSIKENPGVYLKKYTYTDQNGCSGEVELNVVVVNKVKKPVNKVSKNNPIALDENLASKLAKEGISLDEITFDAPILVFPNPSEGVFNLAFADETLDFSAEIFDMAGKKIFSAQNQTKIDLSTFAKGSYLLKVNTKEEIFTQVLILQ